MTLFVTIGSQLLCPRYAVPPLHSSEDEVREALGRWGYPDFRQGQLEAVMRILAGLPISLLGINVLISFAFRQIYPCAFSNRNRFSLKIISFSASVLH